MTEYTEISLEKVSGPKAVLRDLYEGYRMHNLWQTFAWDEIKNRYSRSLFGVAWIAISYLIFVFGIALFFNSFSTRDSSDFLHYVAVGYASFMFIIGNLTDGCGVFKREASWIKSISLPYSVYVYKSVARNVFSLSIHLVCATCVMLLSGWQPSGTVLLAIPAFLFFIINAIMLQMLTGFIASRWQDFGHLVSSMIRILFFTTPIMWVFEERTGLVRKVASFNPLTHFIGIIRMPILGETPHIESWIFVIVITITGWTAAIFVAGKMRRRLAFWL